MDRLAQYEESFRQHREVVRQEAVYRSERERRASYASAMQSVCLAMASNASVLSVIIKDPQEAAESFGDSVRWQLAGILAATGDPETVMRFLKQDSMNAGSGVG